MIEIPDELKGEVCECSEIYMLGVMIKVEFKVTYENESEIIVAKDIHCLKNEKETFKLAIIKNCEYYPCKLTLGNEELTHLSKEEVINVLKQIKESKFEQLPNIETKII